MIDQIIDNGIEYKLVVSITSSSATVPLKVVEMDQLREELEQQLTQHSYQTKLESITEDTLIMQVAKRPAYRTVMTIERRRHRPLEVVVNVDYGQVDEIKDIIRISRTIDRDNWFNSRWIWILLIFVALVAGVISLLRNLIEALVSDVDPAMSQAEQMVVVTAVTVVIVVVWVYGIPLLLRQKKRTLQQMDKQLLDLITTEISQIHQELVASDVVRCWSCFDELAQDDTICPHCGEEQLRK